jgi:hypothetical protein
MMALSAEAVDAVAQAVRGGDGRLALQVLKALGLAAAEPEGPEDAKTVKREKKLERVTAKVRLKQRESEARMQAEMEGLGHLWRGRVPMVRRKEMGRPRR